MEVWQPSCRVYAYDLWPRLLHKKVWSCSTHAFVRGWVMKDMLGVWEWGGGCSLECSVEVLQWGNKTYFRSHDLSWKLNGGSQKSRWTFLSLLQMVLKINAIFEARRGKKHTKKVSQSAESSSGRGESLNTVHTTLDYKNTLIVDESRKTVFWLVFLAGFNKT